MSYILLGQLSKKIKVWMVKTRKMISIWNHLNDREEVGENDMLVAIHGPHKFKLPFSKDLENYMRDKIVFIVLDGTSIDITHKPGIPYFEAKYYGVEVFKVYDPYEDEDIEMKEIVWPQ
jgi:hypothetical protein